MKSEKYIKILNNTELGKGNTNESYVLVTGAYNVNDIFNGFINYTTNFIDKTDNSIVSNIRLQSGDETRIVGLGPYYRKHDLNAGDFLIFERFENSDGSTLFYLNNIKKNNNIILQKVGSKGYEILTQNVPTLYPLIIDPCFFNEDYKKNVEIRFKQSIRKRSDSPNITDFYEILVDGISLNLRDKEMIEIVIDDKIIKQLTTWNKYTLQW
ncbi:hypothetical protein [Flavobacterium sp. I3-2]|uniref:hypothetical protein n=1 Tax=Flavobacterium sp. I3-2 TaxID=2748319 RepID=UPI0015AD2B91|nr:hypothetical protein [Flavobacterium sp. I3-2]